jgi:hypothetical protein
MIELLLIGLLVLLLIGAALSPLESLSWWAGWYGERDALAHDHTLQEQAAAQPAVEPATHYIVYLSGIGAISGDSVPPEETIFLDRLEAHLPPSARLVRDVFPYSVTNIGLTGNRAFGVLWRRLERLRLRNANALLTNLINIRNLFQVAVSADPRYGPIANFGVAQEIIRVLLSEGYPLRSGTPVTLIGWSGGGQISLGASTYLRGLLGAPIRVISIGGVMADDPGLLSLSHLIHLYGEKDPVQRLGGILYAGRWPIMAQSPWNRAQADGRITLTSLGPMAHNGKGNYFDHKREMADGQSYMDRTIAAVAAVLVEVPAASVPATVPASSPHEGAAP